MHMNNIYKTIEEFSEKIADAIVIEGVRAIRSHDFFTLVLSGGNTPKYIFKAMTEKYSKHEIWAKTHIFWLDERCVPVTHEASNYGLAEKYLFQLINPASVHKMYAEGNTVDAAQQYSKVIEAFFLSKNRQIGFDCILLGMGEDGHVASIFPDEEIPMDNLVGVTRNNYGGFRRMTLTIPMINTSKKIILMITNEKKNTVFLDRQLDRPVHKLNQNKLQIYKTI